MTEIYRPDWNSIANKVDDSLSQRGLNAYWNSVCNDWLSKLADSLEGQYDISETSHFFILSDESDRYLTLFSDFLEKKRKRILATLPGIVSDKGFGKHVVLIFKDVDQYYDYIDYYYPENSTCAPNAGIFIDDGFGHFAFPTQDLSIAEPIAVHELTHACLAHLEIPLWLNEGIAVTMEEMLSQPHFNYMASNMLDRHKSFWCRKSIQRFWRGDSFHELGEGQALSYALAYFLVRVISGDYDKFQQFVSGAIFSDAGESSALENFGISLGKILENIFGPGEWAPPQIA